MNPPESPDLDVGTQPAAFEDLDMDLDMDSVSTIRPMSTQAIFRPQRDDEITVDSAPIETDENQVTVARTLATRRRLGGGLVEIPRVAEIDPLAALMVDPGVAEWKGVGWN